MTPLPDHHPVRKNTDLAIRIASRDKDLTQLCSPRVDMFDAMKDALVTPSDVFKTEGVEPTWWGTSWR